MSHGAALQGMPKDAAQDADFQLRQRRIETRDFGERTMVIHEAKALGVLDGFAHPAVGVAQPGEFRGAFGVFLALELSVPALDLLLQETVEQTLRDGLAVSLGHQREQSYRKF